MMVALILRARSAVNVPKRLVLGYSALPAHPKSANDCTHATLPFPSWLNSFSHSGFDL
jgi:hypothetical protein